MNTLRFASSSLCLLALAISSAACASPTGEQDDTASGSQEPAAVDEAHEPLDAVVENTPAPVDEPAASSFTYYKWLGATNGATFQAYPYSGHLRAAVRVRVDNGIVTSYRGWAAIFCYKSGAAYPCSVRDGLLIDHVTVPFGTSNTGAHGYYSAYTPPMSPLSYGWEAQTVLRNDPKRSSSIVVGLGGHTFYPGNVLTPAVNVYR